LFLIRIADLGGEFTDGVGAEEEAVGIDVRRFRVPLFPRRRIGIEDRPDRAAAVELYAMAAAKNL
jgi:hypothetical protein